jgi:hypothetical protein
MEQKKAFEQYRVAAFAAPHPAHNAAAASEARTTAAGAAGGEAIQPDTQRVILHFDVDCFYSQASRRTTILRHAFPYSPHQQHLLGLQQNSCLPHPQ